MRVASRTLLVAAYLVCLIMVISTSSESVAAQAAQDNEQSTDSVTAASYSHYGGGSHNGGGGRRPYYCSCAAPDPVPLANGRRRAAASAASAAAASEPQSWPWHHAGGSSGYPNRYRPPVKPALCSALPEAREGAACGAATAVCSKGLCCSQGGTCSRSSEACDGGCQCAFSGVGSLCRGSFPFPAPRPSQLPTAKPGGPCGIYVANCPGGQCCSQFGFCVTDDSPYCESSSCHSSVSPGSLSCKPPSTAQKVLRHTWTFFWQTVAPDGFARPAIVNTDETGKLFPRLFPNVGDRVIVTMVNKLTEPMSVHWHGMLQMQTPMMDGVTAVTQRPIPPGGNYTYNFIASTPGTYWWHSHYKTQYGDGLWGLMVVNDPADTQTYAADEVLMVQDWYHEVSPPLLQQYLSPASQGNEPVPDAALANLVGQTDCLKPGKGPCSYAYIPGVPSSCDDPKMRLRIWNVGVFAPFNISIDGHRMIVVEEDAVKIEPTEVGSLLINTAQRYVVLVCQPTGKPLSSDPVWIRATMNNIDLSLPPTYNTSKAILYFTDAKPSPDDLPSGPAVFSPPALNPELPPGPDVVNPYFLKTYGDIAPPAATRTVPFVIDFYNKPNRNDPNGTLYAHVNEISLQLQPQSPSLLERFSNNPQGMPPPVNPAKGFGWQILDVKRGEVIDLYVRNKSPGQHPLHLHGHWMWVVAAGLPMSGGMKPGQTLDGRLVRDTVTVNTDSFVVLRFVANNPGLWILHCHIDWHVAAGLGLIIKEAM